MRCRALLEDAKRRQAPLRSGGRLRRGAARANRGAACCASPHDRTGPDKPPQEEAVPPSPGGMDLAHEGVAPPPAWRKGGGLFGACMSRPKQPQRRAMPRVPEQPAPEATAQPEPPEHAAHEGYVVLELIVPEGKGGGDTMEAILEDGHIIELEVPSGLQPGDAFEAEVPASDMGEEEVQAGREGSPEREQEELTLEATAAAGLPEGWSARRSHSRQESVYYVNLHSNATQWMRPTTPAPRDGPQ